MAVAKLILFVATLIVAPSAFAGEPASLQTPTGTLHGTLEMPGRPGPLLVALLHAGSGPTDRDGNNPVGRNDGLKLLAEGLARHGIATLRFDKRGVGASRSAAPAEVDLRFETYIDDAVAWIGRLRRDPRFSGLAVVGHSEGALIGTVAATRTPVDAVVVVSGAGRPAADVVVEQLAMRLASQPGVLEQARRIVEELKAGRTVPDVDPGLAALFRPSVQPYLISWFRYDPAREIARLKIPVLIVHGTTDLQISVDDARALARARPGARLRIIDGMNHVLRLAPSEVPANLETYNNPALPLAPGLIETLATFLDQSRHR